MKKTAITLIMVISGLLQAFSQVPEKFNYQGVLRNSTGELVENTDITVKLSILQGSSTGSIQYSESHSVSTNDYGQFSVQVGAGTPISDSFAGIDWSNEMYMKTEVANPAGGTLVEMGTVQLIPVPYALYAKDVANKDDADANPSNELQNLILTGDTIEITGGNKVVFPYDSSRWAVNNDKLYYNTGNVGVGSANPASKLEVKSASTSGALFQVINANNDTVFAVYPDGVKVFVNSSTKGKVGGFAVSGRSPGKAGEEVEYLRVTADSTRIYVNDSITTKGKVGGFAVSGRSPGKGIINDYLQITRDSTRIFVNDSITTKGKVGGFAVSGRSPGKAGETAKFMDMTKNNYFIGHQAGRSITTGLYNSFIGYNAGISNTDGNFNIFIGYQSGFTNGQGDYNSFIGYQAGYNNEGNRIGGVPLHGSKNCYYGFQAGYLGYNPDNCVMVGYKAGFSNQMKYNTFIGSESGSQNTYGTFNTFVGAYAGNWNVEGQRNTFIGETSGQLNINGSYNVYLGISAGNANDGGNNNVCIGYLSNYGYAYIPGGVGERNVIIGSESAIYNNGSGNILIGYQVANSVNDINDQLIIENSENTTNPMINGDFANNRIAFHAQATTYPLQVGTDETNGNGAYLSAGGAWTNTSSKTLKDRFVDLNKTELLFKIENLDIKAWYYKGTQEYHIGPFAEDFFDAFGTGDNNSPDANKSLSPSDVAGVSLIAIQELIKKNNEQQKKLDNYINENSELKKQLIDLNKRIELLEK
ncbi:MAG: hypothetical protein RBT49_08675 [Bacteroidales bacterium]|jgi:hypothetical protein|nr:hypothetical protein [Bacteroidales bacterium]